MKVLGILVALLLLQTPVQPPAGEPPEFPTGHFCKIPADVRTSRDHPCHCRDMDDCSKPEEGQGQGPTENNQCKQWCHKDHCQCATRCQ